MDANILLVNCAYSVATLYYLYCVSGFWYHINKHIKTMQDAKALSRGSQPGDYVFFNGQMAMAPTVTPFLSTPCSFYDAMVNAEFETKAPKPSKGMQTHRPRLLQKSNDDLPLLLSNNDLIVHLGFSDNRRLIQNYLCQCVTKYVPPSEEVAALAKPKYKRYLVEEKWLPQNATMCVWGTLVDANEHCFTIAQDEKASKPALAIHGTVKDMTKAFKGKQQKAVVTGLAFAALLAIGWILPLAFIPAMIYAVVGIGVCHFGFKQLQSSAFKNKTVQGR